MKIKEIILSLTAMRMCGTRTTYKNTAGASWVQRKARQAAQKKTLQWRDKPHPDMQNMPRT